MIQKAKETFKETLYYLMKKKTIYILIFIIVAILAIRADFSCGWKDGKFNAYIGIKNIDKKILDYTPRKPKSLKNRGYFNRF
jgi:hypothetical protein